MSESHPRWGAVLSATLFVALVAALCASAVHSACFHPPPPVLRPDPGTPRGEYCAFVDSKVPWVSLTLGPTLAMALAGYALRRRPRLIFAAALVVALALIANAVSANSLTSSLTI